MNTRSELPQPQADRTIEGKIKRLRTRLDDAKRTGVLDAAKVASVLYGVLDLLDDEL